MSDDHVIPGLSQLDQLEASGADDSIDPELILAQILDNPAMTQYWQRYEIEGQDAISAFYRCGFLEGQQRYILNVPFHPPFQKIPNVSAALVDDTSGRVRITHQQKFGARIEIVLSQPATTAHSCLLEFTAESH